MASGKTLYIKGDRDVEVTKPDVTLADLLSMECSDQSLLPKLKTMKILKFKKTGNQRCVISVLKIIACIHGQYPDMEVQNLGETDMIVTYEDQKNTVLCMASYKNCLCDGCDILRGGIFDHGV